MFAFESRKKSTTKTAYVVLYAVMDYVNPGVFPRPPATLLSEKKDDCPIVNIDLSTGSLAYHLKRHSRIKAFLCCSSDLSKTLVPPQSLNGVLPFHRVFITSGVNLCTTRIVSKENVCEKMLDYMNNKHAYDLFAQTAGPKATQHLLPKTVANNLIRLLSLLVKKKN